MVKILLPCLGLLFVAYYVNACDSWDDGLKCKKLLSLFNKPLKDKKLFDKKCDKCDPPAGSTIVLMPAGAPRPPLLPIPPPLPYPLLPPVYPHVHPKPAPCSHRPQPIVVAPHSHHHPHPLPLPIHPSPIPLPIHPLPPVALPPFLPAPYPHHSPLVISIVPPDHSHHHSHCSKCQHHHHHIPHHHHHSALPCPLPPAVPMIAYAVPPPVPCSLEPKASCEKKHLFHKCDKHSKCDCDD